MGDSKLHRPVRQSPALFYTLALLLALLLFSAHAVVLFDVAGRLVFEIGCSSAFLFVVLQAVWAKHF